MFIRYIYNEETMIEYKYDVLQMRGIEGSDATKSVCSCHRNIFRDFSFLGFLLYKLSYNVVNISPLPSLTVRKSLPPRRMELLVHFMSGIQHMHHICNLTFITCIYMYIFLCTHINACVCTYTYTYIIHILLQPDGEGSNVLLCS